MSTPMLARAASGCNELNYHLHRYRSIVPRMLSAIPRYSRKPDYLYSKCVARPLKKEEPELAAPAQNEQLRRVDEVGILTLSSAKIRRAEWLRLLVSSYANHSRSSLRVRCRAG